MKATEKFISPLLAQMFPALYREEGPMFVTFVKAYYEWMESSNNTLYHARRLPDYRDIDTTIEDFIVHFKEKYLKDIQFETSSNKRLFIKNAIPFYRSKGTERSVDLFFKLIYGIPAKVYYPGDDIFKLSDGEWSVPMYLEVIPSEHCETFIGKTITGVNSGAKAFVEDLVVKRVKSKYVHVLFISNLEGNFEYDEVIRLFGEEPTDNLDTHPRTIGSLRELEVIDGASGFEVGETVNFISANGAFASAIVTGVEDISGQVQFTLEDGGFGYNSDSEVLISEKVLTVANVANVNFADFETVSQPLVKINYNVGTALFTLGEEVFRYYANNLVAGSGYIVDETQIANTGNLVITVSSGNLYAGVSTLYNSSNAISANIVTNTNVTATGNVIGRSANIVISANNRTGTYLVGEEVYQGNVTSGEWANAVVISSDDSGLDVIIRVSNTVGTFKSGEDIVGRTSNTTANLQSFQVKVGVIDVTNEFFAVSPSYMNELLGGTSTANGYISAISVGEDASFELGANGTMDNIEVFSYNTDTILPYEAVDLDATLYGFPALPAGNLTSNPIIDFLQYANLTIGTITTIVGINPGTDFNEPPFIRVLNPQIYQYGYQDYNITISNPTSSFVFGETIKASNSIGSVITGGAIGKVLSQLGSTLKVRRLLLANSFTTGHIVGTLSGAIAAIDSVETDTNSNTAGFNAVITANVATLAGSVTELTPTVSGYGYMNDEYVGFYKASDLSIQGTAKVTLTKQGLGQGFFKQTGGFLSANKYLFDAHYYQEYSYDIITALPFDRYSDMFKKVLHVAGTRAYGTYESETITLSDLNSPDSEVSYASNNLSGTVAGNTTTSTLTGTGTTFLTDFANNDYIVISDGGLSVNKLVLNVLNDTEILMSGPLPFTNSTATYARLSQV